MFNSIPHIYITTIFVVMSLMSNGTNFQEFYWGELSLKLWSATWIPSYKSKPILTDV